MSAFERSTLSWARAAVGISALAAGFICLQWWEMRKGGTDTHDLAVAAEQQAARTKDLADRMKEQADSTRTIADQAIIQARANQKLAQNATDTLANDREAFREEQRAWMGVESAAGRPLIASAPWAVQMAFFNSGRTPARDLQIAVMYKISIVPLSGPPARDIKALRFHRVESVAPQGHYYLNMGTSPGAEGASAFATRSGKILVAEYPFIKSGRLFLYYYGILKYDDGFGNRKWTQFCILLANPQTGEVGFCDHFNDLN